MDAWELGRRSSTRCLVVGIAVAVVGGLGILGVAGIGWVEGGSAVGCMRSVMAGEGDSIVFGGWVMLEAEEVGYTA